MSRERYDLYPINVKTEIHIFFELMHDAIGWIELFAVP